MATSPANEFAVRPFQDGDSAGVRAVLESSYGERATPRDRYEWWSFGHSGAKSGFMVAETRDRIVGVQPMGTAAWAEGGRELKGALLTGVAVHPEFRRRGVFSALVAACEQEAWRQGAAFVTTMPNEKSRPGFLKLDYLDLGRRQLLVRPLRSLPVLGHLFGAAAKSIRSDGRFSFREVNTLSPGLPLLAKKHAELFPGLCVCRSVEWLEWRFLQAPLRRYEFLEAWDEAGRLAGFAVTLMERRHGFDVCYLMDLLVSEQRVLNSLLGALCHQAKSQCADGLAAVVSSKPLATALRGTGFWGVPSWFPVKQFYSVAKFNPRLETPAAWRTLAGWQQTLADWDNL